MIIIFGFLFLLNSILFLKKFGIRLFSVRYFEMGITIRGHHPATACAVEEAKLHEEGFVDVFDGFDLLRRGGGDGVETHGPAIEFFDDSDEDFSIRLVEAELVDADQGETFFGQFQVHGLEPLHRGEITHPFEEAVGDAGGFAGASGDLADRLVLDFDVEDRRRALEDAFHLGILVEIQFENMTETVAQGRRQQARLGGGADQGEFGQVDAHGSGGRPLADDDVEREILHGGIQDFLDLRLEAVDFVDEQDVIFLEVAQNRGQVALLFDGGARGGLDVDPHFVGDDVGQRGFAQARGTVEQDVLDGLLAFLGRLQGDREIALDVLLAHVFAQNFRTQAQVELFDVALDLRGAGDGVVSFDHS